MALLLGDGEVPVGAERSAEGHGGDEAEGVVDGDDGKEDVGGAAGVVVGEDADVEEENGDFGKAQAELVEDDVDEGVLRRRPRRRGLAP